MLGADTGVIQPGRNGMSLDDLTVRILHQIGAVAVQHTHRTVGGQRCSMLPADYAVPARLHADQLHAGHVDVGIEHTHRVGAAADTGDHHIRLATCQFRHLHHTFLADDGIEIAHHHRIRMRPGHRADDVKRIFDVGHPVAHRFVERVLECPGTALHRHHGRAEQLHAIYILRLALHVFRAHIHHAFHAVARRHGSGRHTMLARASLGDHARFAHAFGQQCLPHGVVHLVRAGMVEVFALQKYLRATELLRPAFGVIDRAGAADEMLEIVIQLGDKFGIVAILFISLIQLFQRAHQGFGDINAAVRAEVAGVIGIVVHLFS